jgi:phosphohistidine phosphatase
LQGDGRSRERLLVEGRVSSPAPALHSFPPSPSDPRDNGPVKLYVLRHGPAEDNAPSGLDADRALTSSGRDRVRDVAKALVDADELPLTIVTSPLVRCVQTSEIVALVTKLSHRDGMVETRRELAPGGDSIGLARTFAAEARARILFCGHEPDLSHLVSTLLGERMSVPMQKAMVVSLQLASDGAAKLRFILDPKTLVFENDAR